MTSFHRSAEWAALTRKMRPLFTAQVNAGTAVCVDCGGPVLPGEHWDVGHRLARVTHPHLALAEHNVGPSHRGCNRPAGARLQAQLARGRKRRAKTMIGYR